MAIGDLQDEALSCLGRINSSVTRASSCFHLKFSFPFPGAFWSRQGLFLAQTCLVKLPAISNSQAGTPGAATEASCPVGSYSGMFALDTHKGFLLTHSPVQSPWCQARVAQQPVFMPLIKEQHPGSRSQLCRLAREAIVGC